MKQTVLKHRNHYYRKKLIRNKQMNSVAMAALKQIEERLSPDHDLDVEYEFTSIRSTVKDALRTIAKMKQEPYRKTDGKQI